MPPALLAAYDPAEQRQNYLEMQAALADLRLRERAELGQAFHGATERVADKAQGFTFRVARLDSMPEWASALARNDPTLLAKNDQHHTKLVAFLPVGKSVFLPHCKSSSSQGCCASARAPLAWPGRMVVELNALRAPSARMMENHPARLRRG